MAIIVQVHKKPLIHIKMHGSTPLRGGIVPKTPENQFAFGVLCFLYASCSLKQASFAYGHKKTSALRWFSGVLAEKEGFEPPVPLGTLVFKTSAFDHSAISPVEGVLLPKWAANLNRI